MGETLSDFIIVNRIQHETIIVYLSQVVLTTERKFTYTNFNPRVVWKRIITATGTFVAEV